MSMWRIMTTVVFIVCFSFCSKGRGKRQERRIQIQGIGIFGKLGQPDADYHCQRYQFRGISHHRRKWGIVAQIRNHVVNASLQFKPHEPASENMGTGKRQCRSTWNELVAFFRYWWSKIHLSSDAGTKKTGNGKLAFDLGHGRLECFESPKNRHNGRLPISTRWPNQ